MELIDAVKKNDYNKVKQLVENGVDIEFRDEFDNTPLIWACGLVYVSYPNIKNTECLNSLEKLSEEDIYKYIDVRLQIIKLLLDNNANINHVNNTNHSSFLVACMTSITSIIDLVLNYVPNGSNIMNHSNHINICPITVVVCDNFLDFVIKFYKNGANLNILPPGNNLLLCSCEKYVDNTITQFILENNTININDVNSDGNSCLIIAVKEFLISNDDNNNSLDKIKLLLKYDCDTQIKNKQNKKAIDIAYIDNNIECFTILLNYETDINKNPNGEPFFSKACIANKLEIAKLLFNRGANIHYKNKYNNNGFILACYYDSYDVVLFLLENVKDEDRNDVYDNELIIALQYIWKSKVKDDAYNKLANYITNNNIDINKVIYWLIKLNKYIIFKNTFPEYKLTTQDYELICTELPCHMSSVILNESLNDFTHQIINKCNDHDKTKIYKQQYVTLRYLCT